MGYFCTTKVEKACDFDILKLFSDKHNLLKSSCGDHSLWGKATFPKQIGPMMSFLDVRCLIFLKSIIYNLQINTSSLMTSDSTRPPTEECRPQWDEKQAKKWVRPTSEAHQRERINGWMSKVQSQSKHVSEITDNAWLLSKNKNPNVLH